MKTKAKPFSLNTTERAEVLSVLHGTRKSRQLTVPEIAHAAGVKESHPTCPATRGHIRDLIDEGYAICSSSHGYFIAHDAEELEEYIEALFRRVDGLNRRIKNLTHCFRSL